jgi:hypothetical protein
MQGKMGYVRHSPCLLGELDANRPLLRSFPCGACAEVGLGFVAAVENERDHAVHIAHPEVHTLGRDSVSLHHNQRDKQVAVNT